ncbi:MAG: ABC transporter ATP-binding protein [Candidatus Hodarchaeota archaeon]
MIKNLPIKEEDNYLTVFLLVLRRTAIVFKDIFQSFPLYSLFLILLTVITGFLPIVTLWISKLLLDNVVVYLASSGQSELLGPVLFMLGIQFAVGVVTLLLTQGNSYISVKLSQLITFKMEQEIYQHCLSMDYAFFEKPEQQDKLFRTKTQSAQASSSLFTAVISIGEKLVTILSSGVALFLFSPLLCLVGVCIVIPSLMLNIKLAFEHYEIIEKRSERSRKTSYIAYLLLHRHFVRDNILFGTGNYFFNKWKSLQQKTLFEDLSVAFRRNKIGALGGLMRQMAQFGSYIYIVWVTARQAGTVGSVVMNVGLFANAQGQIQGMADDFATLYRNSIFLNDYYSLRQEASTIECQKTGISIEGNVDSIEFENVSFKYPNSKRYALKEVSLKINSRECVCLVGSNGAGKSTMIKLILRLYDPASGQIYINGRNIKEYAPSELRKTFSVLMQDFSAYPLSVKENIITGDIDKLNDGVELQKAIDSAGLTDTVSHLPNKEGTILGKIFGDGEDLSIGEWQRLGLARIFFRNAPVVILDEPTSSLDAKMEETILEHFRKMTAGRLSILVSHRFSSARISDRILVLDSGKVVETGTHTELMKENGVYAQLFRIQRKRYVGDEDDKPETKAELILY